MLRMVIYTSSAAEGFGLDDLREVLAVSRRNNARRELSGMLLFEGGTFLQVVEGPSEPLMRTLRHIERDKRHSHVDVLFDQPLERRCFGDWSMGSCEVDGEGTFTLSKEEMTARLPDDAPDEVRVMVNTFFRVNKRFVA